MLDVSPAEEETLKELEELLRCEAEKIGLTDPYNLEIRGHSKSYWGKYNPNTNTVILYVLDDNGKLYPLWDIMKAFIHELIHCRPCQHESVSVAIDRFSHISIFQAQRNNNRFAALEQRKDYLILYRGKTGKSIKYNKRVRH